MRSAAIPLQGLPPRRPGAVAHHDARPRRVHQALPAPRPAKGVPPHPSLRAARQCHLQEEYRACQRTDRHARAGDRSAGGARRGGPSRRRRSRPSPAMPLLRWPHDYRRDLRARRCTPRPAVARYRGQDRDAMTPSPPHRTTHLPGNLASGIAALLTGGLPRRVRRPRSCQKHPPARRQNPGPDRRPVAHYDDQCSPYPRRCPGKSP